MSTEEQIKKERKEFIKFLLLSGFDVKMFPGSKYIKGENNESI
jgi:hypothetical protein